MNTNFKSVLRLALIFSMTSFFQVSIAANCDNLKHGQASFFQHSKFKGSCVVRNLGNYSNSKAIGIGNDKISSIKMSSGTQVRLCSGSKFKGKCKTYTTSMESLGAMNDKTSSAIVGRIPPPARTPVNKTPSASCNPNANQVAFFQHGNYKGACVVRNVGRYAHSNNIGLGSDKISSVKIGSSTQLKLCKHGNFMGGCKTYKSSMSSLGDMNDKASSALIERKLTTNNTPPTQKPNFNLKGDTSCRWGSKDCNRCVNDVKANFNAIETHFNGQHGNKMHVRCYAYDTKNYLLHRINSKWGYEHIQGVGRIAGLGNDEYLVFTHSTMSKDSGKNGALAVVRMGANQNSNGFELGDLRDSDGKNQNTNNRTVARTFSGSNHPGGLSTLGHFVFVADWCQPHGKYDWCNKPSEFAFEVYDVSNADKNVYKINSNPPLKIIDRSVFKIGDKKRSTSIASVAATRLNDGRYLVGIGRSGGKNYEYFLSKTTQLSRNTTWSPVSNVEPISKWGEGAAMVNECGTGDVYLIQMEKTTDDFADPVLGGGKDALHLFKLNHNASQGRISHQYINSRTFKCSEGTAWCDFDKGVGIYTTPNGNLYVYATDAQQAKKTERFRMVEFGNYLETGKATVFPSKTPPKRKPPPYVYEENKLPPIKTAPSKNDAKLKLRAPSDLRIDGKTKTTINLSWFDHSNREYGVEVYRIDPVEARQNPSITWEFVGLYQARIDSNIRGTGRRTDEDSDLLPGTNYCYKLRTYFGFDRKQVSDYSKPVCTTTLGEKPSAKRPKVTVKRR